MASVDSEEREVDVVCVADSNGDVLRSGGLDHDGNVGLTVYIPARGRVSILGTVGEEDA